MHNHEPENYACPFCCVIGQASLDGTDIVFRGEHVSAFLGLGRWEKNPLDVLIVPNRHIENLYDLPDDLAPALQKAMREMAVVLKGLTHCEGVSTRQHNEPAGDQDVWHYHIHVTPRFEGDRFYEDRKVPFPEAERLALAKRFRDYMNRT